MDLVSSELNKFSNVIKRALSNWMFWISIIWLIKGVFFTINVYNYRFPLVLFFGWIIFFGINFAFVAAFFYLVYHTIKEFIRYIKTKTLDFLPLVLLIFQIGVIYCSFVFPVPDYFKTHENDLNKLSQYIENKVRIEGLKGNGIDIKPPKELRSISDREIHISRNNDLVKIEVELTSRGSIFGNIFLLYRSDRKAPDKEDLRNIKRIYIGEMSPFFSTYKRRNEKWFQIDIK
jgi:hypothetical protein